jgi:hypothetical protein
LFPTPQADDEIARYRYNSLDNVFGYGFDIRHGFSNLKLIVGLSFEYLEKTGRFHTRFELDDETFDVPTLDGYYMIPIEAAGYFIIPISSERVRWYIGGGAGIYLGRRTFEIADARSESVEQSVYPGIHVASGVEYYVHPRIGVRGEMKFRDPDIETRNRFAQESITFEGTTLELPHGDVPSRINVDGIAFTLALVYRF